jgi:hypothetical protein
LSDTDADAGGVLGLADRVEWLDPEAKIGRDALTSRTPAQTRCPSCLDGDEHVDVARGAYQLVTFPAGWVLYQLLRKHGLAYVSEGEPDAVGDRGRTYVAPDGLTVTATGHEGDGVVSYLDVRGPAAAAGVFVEDLLDVATAIKRELRALALVEDAAAAQREGQRVPDERRLVDRETAADVVRRLPAPSEVSAE